MKYLKMFNESNIDYINEINNFCEEYLSYLFDNNFTCHISEVDKYQWRDKYMRGKYEISIERISTNSAMTTPFLWEDISTHFIPFLSILNETYDICILDSPTKHIWKKSTKYDNILIIRYPGPNVLNTTGDTFNINDIINCDFDFEYRIRGIKIVIS